MTGFFRQVLIAMALLFVASLCLLQLSDVVLCGGFFKTCPGTPQWRLVEWIGEHQVGALGAVGAYAAASFALFGRESPQVAAESIKPKFFARAFACIAAVSVVLALATHFPRIAALLAWGT